VNLKDFGAKVEWRHVLLKRQKPMAPRPEDHNDVLTAVKTSYTICTAYTGTLLHPLTKPGKLWANYKPSSKI
jgi:hypothetical protein